MTPSDRSYSGIAKLIPADPVEAIKSRMEQLEFKPSSLAKILGGQRCVAAILNGKRKLTAGMLRLLRKHLAIPAESLWAQTGREAVDAGGLVYYGADFAESYRQVAWYIDKILKGAKPADPPVQRPMKFDFVINLQTAWQIGVTSHQMSYAGDQNHSVKRELRRPRKSW